jgi:hypothetical protein
MEIAASAAPRPQILVAASGDWTKDTLTVEGPSIAHIYQLLNHPERLRYVRFDFDHNYNQISREAVYQWFGLWLLRAPEPSFIKEAPFQKEPDADLRVFPGNELPDGALSLPRFLGSVRELHRRELRALDPGDAGGLKRFQSVMMPAWRHTLLLDLPVVRPEVHGETPITYGDFTMIPAKISRAGQETGVLTTYWAPPGILKARSPQLIIMVSQNESSQSKGSAGPPEPVLQLLQRGLAVLVINQFSPRQTADPFNDFYTTYNRTELQQRVGDLLMVCAAARSIDPRQPVAFRVTLFGIDRAGLLTLLAAPAADAVIADCDAMDISDETTLLAPDLFCPGILALGGFETAAILAAPHPLLLHNTGSKFSTGALRSAYVASGVMGRVKTAEGHLTNTEIADWVSKL